MTDLIQKQALLLRKGDRIVLEASLDRTEEAEVIEVRDRDEYLSIRCRDGVLLDYFADEMVWTVAR